MRPQQEKKSLFDGMLANNADATSPLDSYTNVKTPENIAFNYRIAGPHRRFFAFLVDGFLIIASIALLGIVGGIIVGMLGTAIEAMGLSGALETMGNLFGAFWLIFFFAVWWFYGVFLEAYMNGQTFGKRLLKLRVVTFDGRPINAIQAAARNILRYADFFPLFTFEMVFGWLGNSEALPFPVPTFIVGLVFMSITRRHQRVGDLICGTMVVYEEPRWIAEMALVDDMRTPALAEYIPADFVVSRDLAKALAHYVDRRRYFDPGRRAEIAKHLAEPLLERFEMRSDTSYDLILCALYYRTFIAKKEGEEEFAREMEAIISQSQAPRSEFQIVTHQ